MKVSTLKKANTLAAEIDELGRMEKKLESAAPRRVTFYTGDGRVEVGRLSNLGQTLLDIACAEIKRQIASLEQQFRDLQDDPNEPEDG